MFYDNIIRPFIAEMTANPDKTAARLGQKIVTNSQIAQHVAPIMNELDAMSVQRVAVLLEPDLNVYAAIIAAMFNGIAVYPIDNAMPQEQRDGLCKALQITEVLTAQRMHYYYWMTFEDALCRIDNGLYDIPDDRELCVITQTAIGNEPRLRKLHAGDFKPMKRFSFSDFFKTTLPENPELCSIF